MITPSVPEDSQRVQDTCLASRVVDAAKRFSRREKHVHCRAWMAAAEQSVSAGVEEPSFEVGRRLLLENLFCAAEETVSLADVLRLEGRSQYASLLDQEPGYFLLAPRSGKSPFGVAEERPDVFERHCARLP